MSDHLLCSLCPQGTFLEVLIPGHPRPVVPVARCVPPVVTVSTSPAVPV